MKTKKLTLSMETLQDRNMLSASPLAGFDMPTPATSASGLINNTYRNVDISPSAIQETEKGGTGMFGVRAVERDIFLGAPTGLRRGHGFQSPAETSTFIGQASGDADDAAILGHTSISNPGWTSVQPNAAAKGVINNVFTPWTARLIVVTDHGQSDR